MNRYRPRRNRKSASIRSLVAENQLCVTDLVAPLFVKEGKGEKEPIAALPEIHRFSIDTLIKEAKELEKKGICACALFPVIDKSRKDERGQEALNPDGLIPRATAALKEHLPKMCVITDVALDPYTSHGHDGLIENGDVINDPTVECLAEMALVLAKAGSDIVAPSDMMDGRVLAIRKRLDDSGYSHTSILAYTAKYASAFYGPFRDALGSKLQFGDKKSYFLSPSNRREALYEATLDLEEGADILMVKPALPYLDILSMIREKTHLPLAAYHVSGEYSMIKAAASQGWIEEERAFLESLISIKRAGASMIFTYAASFIADVL